MRREPRLEFLKRGNDVEASVPAPERITLRTRRRASSTDGRGAAFVTRPRPERNPDQVISISSAD
jgi:hypothetical protein